MNIQSVSNCVSQSIVHNLIILDESGSMESIKEATVSGFNELVQTIKGIERKFPEQKQYVSLITFNGLGIKTKLFAKKAKNLAQIDEDSFQPDSMTPLYDAIGFSVNKLKRKLASEKQYHVLVTILTDGEENYSKEFTKEDIKQLIETLKKHGWTFTYIGANHDVKKISHSMSIDNRLVFSSDSKGVKKALDLDKKARQIHAMKIRCNESIQENYFEDAKKE